MYQVNAPRIVHETLDGETIVIDTQTGLYFTVAGHGAAIWSALAAGTPPAVITAAYEAAGLLEPAAVESFVNQLVAAELLVPAGAAGQDAEFVIPQLDNADVPVPELKTHADLQELIELDPIHEVDAAQGWPMQNSDK